MGPWSRTGLALLGLWVGTGLYAVVATPPDWISTLMLGVPGLVAVTLGFVGAWGYGWWRFRDVPWTDEVWRIPLRRALFLLGAGLLLGVGVLWTLSRVVAGALGAQETPTGSEMAGLLAIVAGLMVAGPTILAVVAGYLLGALHVAPEEPPN